MPKNRSQGRCWIAIAGVIAGLLAAAGPASAAEGDLDASFGEGGVVSTSLATSVEANDVALDREGRVVAVGNTAGDFALTRDLEDGDLDTSFGGDGSVTTSFVGEARAMSAAVDASGRIVVGGGIDGDFGVVRYLPNGQLDPS
ncbi:MAG TPA: hypothetical protein VEB65_06350, partial [Solirubrobacterales bacterium]|nr:hypothetical protein [Solirubrobacterales bacterium]